MTIERDSQVPDGYQGVSPIQRPKTVLALRAPLTSDRRYPIGTPWVNKSANTVYFLTSVSAGSATWALASPGASDVDTLTADSGGAISPTAGDIVLAGGTNITSAGAGSTITFNLDAAISLATSVTAPLFTSAGAMQITPAAGNDLAIDAATGQDVVITLGDNAGANKLSVLDSDSVEVFAVDSNGGQTYTTITASGLITGNASATINTAGTALTLGGDNSGDAVILGGGTSARAITIGQGAAAHTVAIGQAAAGAITIDTAAGVSIDSATASNFTVTGAADLTLSSSAGSLVLSAGEAAADAIQLQAAAGGVDLDGALQVNIASSQAAANAVRINASNAAGGIDVDDAGGGMTFDSAAGISLDAAAASNFSVSGAGIDLTLASSGGRVVMNGEEAAADALRLLSAAGGLDCDVALQLSLVSSQAAAADSVRIQASAADGGIDIDAGTGGINVASTGVMDLDAAGALSLNSSGAAINMGNDAVAQAINIGTGAAARTITIGNNQATSALVLTAGSSGDITINGTVKELDAEYLYASGTDLTVTQSPILQSNATTGVAPTGSTGDVNLLYMQDGCLMEQFILGTQTIICPRMAAGGLSINGDATNGDGFEFNFGARNSAKHAYTIGTSAAFEFSATLTPTTMAGYGRLFIGFRKVEANNATFNSYTDFVGIGLHAVTSATNVVMETRLNSGGVSLTDSTDAWGGDATAQTVKVKVSAAGVVTFEVGGSAASAAPSYTFDNADVVMPFIRLEQNATTSADTLLTAFKIGFQA